MYEPKQPLSVGGFLLPSCVGLFLPGRVVSLLHFHLAALTVIVAVVGGGGRQHRWRGGGVSWALSLSLLGLALSSALPLPWLPLLSLSSMLSLWMPVVVATCPSWHGTHVLLGSNQPMRRMKVVAYLLWVLVMFRVGRVVWGRNSGGGGKEGSDVATGFWIWDDAGHRTDITQNIFYFHVEWVEST